MEYVTSTFLVTYLALNLIPATLSLFIARFKNYEPTNWFVWGLIFGIFALIAIAFMAAKPPVHR